MPKGRWIVAALALVLAPLGAEAQQWPAKPVKILTGFPPGGPGDTTSRILGEEFAKAFGQPFVVENRPGAAGNIAAAHVAQSPPDGYTLFSANSGALGVNPTLYDKLPYDAAKDFTPITMMVITPMAIMSAANGPIRTLGDLVAAMRTNGAKLNYGTPGIGTLPNIVGEMLKAQVKGGSTHIPYKGSQPIATGLTSGEIQWASDAPITVIAPMKSGLVCVLALTASARWPHAFPDTPTTAEAGVPDLVEYAWFALVGPAGLPREIVAKLHAAGTGALRKPDVIEKLLNLGLEAKPMSPEDTAKYMADTRARWGAVVKAAGMKVE